MFAVLFTLFVASASTAPPYFQAAVNQHNKYRALHGSPALSWDPSLASLAQTYATQLAQNGTFQHGMLVDGHGNRVGQNLEAFTGSSSSNYAVQATQLWYAEISRYNWSRPGFSKSTGHFTQVVWKETALVGIGQATKNGRTVVVANYFLPGNVDGEFPANVLPLNSPSAYPYHDPTAPPTQVPTHAPTRFPTRAPTHVPTRLPTGSTASPSNMSETQVKVVHRGDELGTILGSCLLAVGVFLGVGAYMLYRRHRRARIL